MQENYQNLSLQELRECAKEKGIKRISTYKKAELVDLLNSLQESAAADVAPAQVTKRAERSERSESPERVERAQRQERPERVERTERQERPERVERAQRQERPERVERAERQERPERVERAERQERPERVERAERPECSERVERAERSEHMERTGHAQRQERIEFTEKSERSERVERAERTSQDNSDNSNNRRKGGLSPEERAQLENGRIADGFFEQVNDKDFGFIRCDNYLSGTNDIYVSGTQIRRFNMRTGDRVKGTVRSALDGSRWDGLLYVQSINGESPEKARRRPYFEDLTPIFPDERLHLETPGCSSALRIMDLFSPVGKGQRGMIVSPPKAGKTTLLKDVANAVIKNHPEMHIIILLIDERPEEVTDIKESIEAESEQVEVIYSTFDELPEHHTQVAELVLARAKRMVEQGFDVMILLDSITRLTRAYNLTVNPSGRTLSGGLDPAALNSPKKFFGAARNMRDYGSLTILATALTDTGSRMDDVVFEEFKGTGNMEVVLDRKLSERRLFPAIDLPKSSTRRDDLLLNKEEQECMEYVRRQLASMKTDEAVDALLKLVATTKSNKELLARLSKQDLTQKQAATQSAPAKKQSTVLQKGSQSIVFNNPQNKQ